MLGKRQRVCQQRPAVPGAGVLLRLVPKVAASNMELAASPAPEAEVASDSIVEVVDAALDQSLSLLKIVFTEREEEAEAGDYSAAGWIQENEPAAAPIDSWARCCIPLKRRDVLPALRKCLLVLLVALLAFRLAFGLQQSGIFGRVSAFLTLY